MRPLYLTTLLTALPLAQAHAVGWGNWWQVFEGVWPLPHSYSGSDPATCMSMLYNHPAAAFSATATGVAGGASFMYLYIPPGCSGLNCPPGSVQWRFNNSYAGSVSVASGSPVKLEWACQNSYYCSYSHGGCGITAGGMCLFGSSSSGSTSQTQFSSSGGNFSTGGSLTGATTVYPTATTVYTLNCYGTPAFGSNASLSLTVTVDACGTPIESAGSSGGYMLKPRVKRRLNAAGYNVCLTNNTDNTYFVPARTNAEAASFINAASRLGVTVQ